MDKCDAFIVVLIVVSLQFVVYLIIICVAYNILTTTISVEIPLGFQQKVESLIL